MPQVRQIVKDAAENNYTLASIITGIVNSDAFRLQGQEEAADAATAKAEEPKPATTVASAGSRVGDQLP